MAKIKYTITMVREIPNSDFDVKNDEECLAKVKEYCEDDLSFVMDGAMENSKDTITFELAK